MTRLYLALALVALLVCGALLYRHNAADDAALADAAQHAENGYRVALAKVAARRAMVAKTAERHTRTIAASDTAVTQFHTLADHLDGVPVQLTPAITLVGQPLPPLDTVVTLGFTRAIIASADTAIGKLLAERAAANARIVALNDLTVAQDSALQKADTTITRYKALAEERGCRVGFGWLSIPCPSRKLSVALGGIVVQLVLKKVRP